MSGTGVESLAVLITYHNEGDLLRRCLRSLAEQTRPVDEILVYDDASDIRPDGHLIGNLPIRVVRGEHNIGPARGRNVLLRQTGAAFVHFHDADDAFEPSWCERVRTAFDAGDVDAVFTDVRSVTPVGEWREHVMDLARLEAEKDLVRFCIQGSMLVPAGTYRRAAVERIGGYRESLWQSEDWDFHVRLACARPAYRVIADSLVRIYLRAESRSRDVIAVWRSAVDAIRALATEIPTRYRDELSEAAATAGMHLFRAGALAEARAAFALATELGEPRHAGQPRIYRALAQHAGQEWAERAGSLYRRCVPESLRRLTHRRTQEC